MNKQTFEKLVERMEKEEHKILLEKGEEYTRGNEDVLKNFKGIAEDCGADLKLVWYIYFRKHIDSIANYVKVGEVKSNESIQSRINDTRNYLLLGMAIFEELEK